MTQNLSSTAPGIYSALLSLVQAAAAAQNPTVNVFPFEVGAYEPGSYVTIERVINHHWEWAYLGTFTQYEAYDVCGVATVFTGDSVTSGTVATDVMAETYSVFEACVMTPVMSNRTIPILGGPSNVIEMTPNDSGYSAEPGEIDGQPAGWVGAIPWSFHFRANVTPA